VLPDDGEPSSPGAGDAACWKLRLVALLIGTGGRLADGLVRFFAVGGLSAMKEIYSNLELGTNLFNHPKFTCIFILTNCTNFSCIA
jgi:hypothetical protein